MALGAVWFWQGKAKQRSAHTFSKHSQAYYAKIVWMKVRGCGFCGWKQKAMSWAEDDWMLGLSGRVQQKVKELQIHQERLCRENKQKQLQLDNINITLEKQTVKVLAAMLAVISHCVLFEFNSLLLFKCVSCLSRTRRCVGNSSLCSESCRVFVKRPQWHWQAVSACPRSFRQSRPKYFLWRDNLMLLALSVPNSPRKLRGQKHW